MTIKPEHKDGDDGGDDDLPEIGFEPPLVVWSEDPEEHRRAFVFNLLADPSHDPRPAIQNMDLYCQWLKTGIVPTNQTSPKIKVVKS